MPTANKRLTQLAQHVAAATEAELIRGQPIPAAKDPSCDLSGTTMDPELFAASRLTGAERESFLRDGFVLIDDCLQPEDIVQLTDALDWEHEVKSREDAALHDSAMPDAMNRMGIFTPANQLSQQDALQRQY